jgi:predicted GNAT family N-acyltransferase
MAPLSFVPNGQLTPDQKLSGRRLQNECFSSVSAEVLERCFFAEPFGQVFASENGTIVGQSKLFTRKVPFEGREVLLGGIGGVCVTASARNRGTATQMTSRCIEILKETRCDVACLTANIKDFPEGLYYRLGFRAMKREVSFEDFDGRIRHEGSEMFLQVCSNQLFELIMKSDKTLHMGRGLW